MHSLCLSPRVICIFERDFLAVARLGSTSTHSCNVTTFPERLMARERRHLAVTFSTIHSDSHSHKWTVATSIGCYCRFWGGGDQSLTLQLCISSYSLSVLVLRRAYGNWIMSCTRDSVGVLIEVFSTLSQFVSDNDLISLGQSCSRLRDIVLSMRRWNNRTIALWYPYSFYASTARDAHRLLNMVNVIRRITLPPVPMCFQEIFLMYLISLPTKVCTYYVCIRMCVWL